MHAGACAVVSVRLSKAGLPLALLSDSTAHVLHLGMRAWMRLADASFALSSYQSLSHPAAAVPGMHTPSSPSCADAGMLASSNDRMLSVKNVPSVTALTYHGNTEIVDTAREISVVCLLDRGLGAGAGASSRHRHGRSRAGRAAGAAQALSGPRAPGGQHGGRSSAALAARVPPLAAVVRAPPRRQGACSPMHAFLDHAPPSFCYCNACCC